MPLSSEEENQFADIAASLEGGEKRLPFLRLSVPMLFVAVLVGLAALPVAAWTRWYPLGIIGYTVAVFGSVRAIERVRLLLPPPPERIQPDIQTEEQESEKGPELLGMRSLARRFVIAFLASFIFLSILGSANSG